MALIKLYADHMTCVSCESTIKCALAALDGIENIEINFDIGQIQITRTINKFQDLISALAAAGYPAVIDLGGISPYGPNMSGGACCCG